MGGQKLTGETGVKKKRLKEGEVVHNTHMIKPCELAADSALTFGRQSRGTPSELQVTMFKDIPQPVVQEKQRLPLRNFSPMREISPMSPL